MLNEEDFFWKNFRLGTELQISGTYIYNALYFLDRLEYINHEEDIFEFLYSISVGIERIQKIIVILNEHNTETNQSKFEKSLITHDHLKLLDRIKSHSNPNFGKVHTKFLGLISKFYNSIRYQRFNKSSIYKHNFDKYDFIEFLNVSLKINDPQVEYVENSQRVKKFIGKTVGTIMTRFYEIVKECAYSLGTFTYEIRTDSKAYKIFLNQEFTFEKEYNFKKEILISLMNEKGLNDSFVEYIKSLEPLDLDEGNSSLYIKYLLNEDNQRDIIESYKYQLEEEKSIPRSRDFDIEPIGERQYLEEDFDDWDFYNEK